MKILYVASDTNAMGGIQQYNRKFLSSLRDRGDMVKLLELKSANFFTRALFIAKFYLHVVFFRPDITICAHINYALLGFFAKKLFGRKYIICTHGIDVWDVRSSMKRNAMKAADLITTVAEFTRDKMLAQVPEAKIYLLYNCVDGSKFFPQKASSDFLRQYNLGGKKVILTVGRLLAIEGYKGYDRVICALPEVLKVVQNAVYILVGDGDDTPRVKKMIAEKGLENRVIMPGAYPNEKLGDYYNLADVFVMPSKAEGAPAVFIEALVCGVPVIGGNKDGTPTPLQNGKTGFLIDPENIEEIAQAIISVLTGTAPKQLLDGEFLREETLKKFGLEQFPERVSEVLKIVLEN